MKINITIPVYNEEQQLANSIRKLYIFLRAKLEVEFEIVIADNASTDNTLAIAKSLQREYHHIRVEHLSQKGRGRALKSVWLATDADVLSYMDVDLSTDLACFESLISPIVAREVDLTVGSRLQKASETVRGIKREIISRGYIFLVKLFFNPAFSDAQCGFKAISREAASTLLPLVQDNTWFFDTELLILAEYLGYTIRDLPVKWTDDPDSRVKILHTAIDDISGLIRLRRSLANGRFDGLRRITARKQLSTKYNAIS